MTDKDELPGYAESEEQGSEVVTDAAELCRAEISRAQTEMARAAAVEIAGLQARGEYEKAEKLLDIAQESLYALVRQEQKLYQRAADAGELKTELQRWREEYEQRAAKLIGGAAIGTPADDTVKKLAALGEAMLKKGLMPSAAQLKAMGLTAAQAREFIAAAKVQA